MNKSKTGRPYISLKEKLAALLVERLSPEERARAIRERWPANQILSRFHWDHVNPRRLGGPDRWWNLQALEESEHRTEKTPEDLKKIAKAKRFEKKRAEMLRTPPEDLKPRWRWPKRKLQSRGFKK